MTGDTVGYARVNRFVNDPMVLDNYLIVVGETNQGRVIVIRSSVDLTVRNGGPIKRVIPVAVDSYLGPDLTRIGANYV